ncbi:hypothetical protein BaRGS_00014033 [Batillaria attramentaria]|uniref:Major facilitator superfamily (MFS) profile domain-containing protein n=1 Tax=Batillaria attramentaria TaxID=370345 RepID=A0ABD0L660_9CAEN
MSEYELGRRGCVFTVPHRYVMAVLLMGVFLVAMGGGRSSFALVMAHVTSGQEAKAENALFPQCTTLNTTQDLHVVMSGDKVFLLHAVFYSGFTLTRLPGALLSTWLSPTRVLGTCVLLISASVLSLPLVLPLNNTPLLFALRFFQGGLEGVYQPVVDGLVAAWSTPEEQSRLVTIVYTGLFLAPALALVVAGTTLCYVSWDTPFYTYGLAGIVLSAVWFKYAYDTPDQHPGLSHAERVHHKNHGMAVRQSSKKVFQSIPWRCIMTSFPVWAFVIASFCKTAVLTTLIMAEPQYFLDAYHMNSADVS